MCGTSCTGTTAAGVARYCQSHPRHRHIFSRAGTVARDRHHRAGPTPPRRFAALPSGPHKNSPPAPERAYELTHKLLRARPADTSRQSNKDVQQAGKSRPAGNHDAAAGALTNSSSERNCPGSACAPHDYTHTRTRTHTRGRDLELECALLTPRLLLLDICTHGGWSTQHVKYKYKYKYKT